MRDIRVDHAVLDASIADFAGPNANYYSRAFKKIHDSTGAIPRVFNLSAFAWGPFWAAARGIWGSFWAFLILEIIALVQIGRGTWGNLGADTVARADSPAARAQQFLDRARDAVAAGEDGSRFEELGGNLMRAAERSRDLAEAAAGDASMILLSGVLMLLALCRACGATSCMKDSILAGV
ncbi:MAG: hypothetical protein AB8B97_14485 [Granulosicoccus sp.]